VASTRDQRASKSAPAPAQTNAQAPPERTESADLRYRRYDDSVGSTHSIVVELVPEGSSVLEFGCATGYMSEVLTQRRGCRVVGIELDAEAAAEASARCERVIVGDAETLDLGDRLGDERFDAVLFADVLEHLRDPAGMLRRVRPFVGDDSVVIASIPNVAHASVRLSLLAGRFRYRRQGLLDESHLRFFTRDSIRDLFEETGYVVTHWFRVTAAASESELAQDARGAPPEVDEFLARDPEASTYQFVVLAVPSEASAQLRATRSLLDETETEVEELRLSRDSVRERAAELESVRAELDALRRAHEAQGRHLVSERLAFADQFESEIERLQEEVEWRRGVMEAQEKELATLRASRSLRYTEPLRRIAARFRGR
jgi:O-antigen biosynthesis protein